MQGDLGRLYVADLDPDALGNSDVRRADFLRRALMFVKALNAMHPAVPPPFVLDPSGELPIFLVLYPTQLMRTPETLMKWGQAAKAYGLVLR